MQLLWLDGSSESSSWWPFLAVLSRYADSLGLGSRFGGLAGLGPCHTLGIPSRHRPLRIVSHIALWTFAGFCWRPDILLKNSHGARRYFFHLLRGAIFKISWNVRRLTTSNAPVRCLSPLSPVTLVGATTNKTFFHFGTSPVSDFSKISPASSSAAPTGQCVLLHGVTF